MGTKRKSLFVPVADITAEYDWTEEVDSNGVALKQYLCATGYEMPDVFIPVTVEGSDEYREGARIESIEVYYENADSGLDGFAAPVLYRVELPVMDGDTWPSSGVVATSVDLDESTRKGLGMHKLTVSVSEPEYAPGSACYGLVLKPLLVEGGTFNLYGARVNYVESW